MQQVPTGWQGWHTAYDDPASSLARRLPVVRGHVSVSLASLQTDGCIDILSLCAGEGRDLLPPLKALLPGSFRARLVEVDDSIAQTARGTCRRLGLESVTVLTADAGLTANYTDFLPVDLLLLCGIFGNISAQDIRTTLGAVPAMLRPGGIVIWTRGYFVPDLRSAVRSWVAEVGLVETSWDSEPEGYGVGVARRGNAARETDRPPLPLRLFTFIR